MKIIHGDSLIELNKLPENSVDSVVCDPPYGLSFMGKNTCMLYGVSDIMGLWKHFGIRLKKRIPVGYGLAQTMGLVMVKYALRTKSIILIVFLTSGQKVKSLKGIILTTYAECQLVATQTTWKLLHRKLISIVASQQSHILLRLNA